jgi:hypothetical protein
MTSTDDTETHNYRARLVELVYEINDTRPDCRVGSTPGNVVHILLSYAYVATVLADLDPTDVSERQQPRRWLNGLEERLKDDAASTS